MKNYNKLCTEFYILDKIPASGNELDFYIKLLKPKKGPFLEAMSGSGRLLIPLIKNGINIDGIDNSHYMINECKKACSAYGLRPNLYEQSITEISIPKKYAGIIIACGSFQLLAREESIQTLELLKKHLLPGGFIALETFIPWESIKASIREDQILENVVTHLQIIRSVKYPDNSTLNLTISKTTICPKKQYELSYCVYEKYSPAGALLETDEEELRLQWYYLHEMELILEKAGFSKIKIIEASLELNPNATVFIAS